MKDETPLETLKVIEGETFHAVIKSETQNNPPPNTSEQPPSSTNPNPNLGTGLGGLGGLGGMGGGFGGLGGSPGFGGGMSFDPAAMSGMIDMMTPEMMEQAINSNPMLRTMVDSNPQLKTIMSNPQLMKQMISSMSNP